MEDLKGETQEMAGHLLAEMHQADDDYRHGKMNKDQYLMRLRVIRRRARSGNNGYLRSMEEVQRTFTGLMTQAETLKSRATA
ncbi:MAG: hypothetical protein B7Z80_08680 [Rhodospirillales bacterium 20-64-7]|nr:MAG: hypothetical protein B7Z80_08680 [Rhodospirillales bacterium 20-64-7]